MKVMKLRTKIEVTVVFLIMLLVSISSVFSAPYVQLGIDSSGQFWGIGGYNVITNSEGNEWLPVVGNIQAAIDNGGNNTVVSIPGGMYNLTQTIWINYTGVTLRGIAPTEIGQSATPTGATRFNSAANLPEGMIQCKSSSSRYGSGVTIENIQFTSGGFSNKAIVVNGSKNAAGHGGFHGLTISGCSFDNILNTAIYVNYSYNSKIVDCIFSNCGGDVDNNPTIYLDEEVNSMDIYDCCFEADEYVSIYAHDYSANTQIHNNFFEAVYVGGDPQPDEAFVYGNFSTAYINDNYMTGIEQRCDGIYLGGTQNYVSNNRIALVDYAIRAGSFSTVVGNIIISFGSYGIYAITLSVVTGNYVDGDNNVSNVAGIYIGGNYVTVTGNTLYDCIFGIKIGSYAGFGSGLREYFSISNNNMIKVTSTYSNNSYITNSNGKQFSTTGWGLQSAIWDLNGTGGTVWIPTSLKVFSPTVPSNVTLIGYGNQTQNYGNVSIAAGASSKTFNHNLSMIPSNVQVTVRGNSTCANGRTSFDVRYTSTTITIEMRGKLSAECHFMWYAKV